MAAATTASEAAERVALVDDNPALGGQVWRAEKAQLSQWSTRLRTRRIDLLCGATVFHIDVPSRTLYAETQIGLLKLRYSQLILATGAREVFLPFPGWTLPNVMAAGGLQAMVKSGLPIAGKRVVVAGTGPLLLAVAAFPDRKSVV